MMDNGEEDDEKYIADESIDGWKMFDQAII